MHIILEPNTFLERLDKFLTIRKGPKGRQLRIAGCPLGKVTFKCDPESLELPAQVLEEGEAFVMAESARNALRMFSRIDNVEIFTQGPLLVIKQRNFTMNLPCASDSDPKNFADALSADRLLLLKLEKQRLKEAIKRIDNEIASIRGGRRVRRVTT